MRTLLCIVSLVLAPAPAGATVIFLAGFDGFAGRGLAPGGDPTTLDSRRWRVEGLSEGDSLIGETRLGGDFGRGASPGGVSAGGLYAFLSAPGDPALGLQPTGPDLTPGSLLLRLLSPGADLAVSFDLATRNDGDRSTRMVLGVAGATATSFRPVAEVASPAGRDATPGWAHRTVAAILPAPPIAAGEPFWLRWRFEDGAGRGSRDEFAIDDLRITAAGLVPEPPVGALLLAAAAGLPLVARRRRRE